MKARLLLHQNPVGYQKSSLLSLWLWESHSGLHPLHPHRDVEPVTQEAPKRKAVVCSGESSTLNTLLWEAEIQDLRLKLNLFVLLTFINMNRSVTTRGEPASPSGAYTDFANCWLVTSVWGESCRVKAEPWSPTCAHRTRAKRKQPQRVLDMEVSRRGSEGRHRSQQAKKGPLLMVTSKYQGVSERLSPVPAPLFSPTTRSEAQRGVLAAAHIVLMEHGSVKIHLTRRK